MDQRKQNVSVVIGSILVAVLVASHYYFKADSSDESQSNVWRNDWLDQPAADGATLVPDPLVYDSGPEQELLARAALDIKEISEELTEPLRQKEFRIVNDQLLQVAAHAVETADDVQLGRVLSLLGQLSIEEQDFDSAEVYLMEALDVYKQEGDAVGAAQVHMHLGRMHLKVRQRARTAGQAYDRLLLARWQLSHGQYYTAEVNLRLVIDENLSINRFGAAASAYNSLVRVYMEVGDSYEAEQTAMEAARLYAASGQVANARSVVTNLKRAGVEDWRLFGIEQEIDRRFEEFRANVEQIARAQDYRRLYHYYRSQGEQLRAWKLRLQSGKSLRNVSKRAMYRRIPDVLALLYVSNDNKARAHDYFDLASQTFEIEGRQDLVSQTQRLKGQIL